MPCRGPTPEEVKAQWELEYREWKATSFQDLYNELTRIMCQEFDNSDPRTHEAKQWWVKHKKFDQMRRRGDLIASARKKLTPEEREILGL